MKRDCWKDFETVHEIDIKAWSLILNNENGHERNSSESKQIDLSLSIRDERKKIEGFF